MGVHVMEGEGVGVQVTYPLGKCMSNCMCNVWYY